MTDIKLSVICLTYNHADFIRRALDGFVSQMTDFPFEVIVHDDASTDGTADIVREYAKKYPELIKAICQKENVYSQGRSPIREFVLPVMRGEYMALCEGDDYWTDENKLQLQYDYVKAHHECALCVHQATIHDFTKNTDRYYSSESADRLYSIEEIIQMRGGAFATNSVFMKKEVYLNIPDCLKAKGFGDFQLFINGALNGTVYYMARNMSTYNFGAAGSWTQRTMFNKAKATDHFKEAIRMLTAFDEAYEHKYHDAVEKAVAGYEYEILKFNGHFFSLKKEPYAEFYQKDLQKTGFIKLFGKSLVYRFDFLYKMYYKIKNRNNS